MGTFTMATGLGMLATGLIVMAVMATVFLLVVRMMERNRQEEEQRKPMERRFR